MEDHEAIETEQFIEKWKEREKREKEAFDVIYSKAYIFSNNHQRIDPSLRRDGQKLWDAVQILKELRYDK